MNLKTRFAEGKTTHRIVLKRRSSHTGRENPRTRVPLVHKRLLPVRQTGPSICFGMRHKFFNINMTFVPTGSRIQDLKSASTPSDHCS
jgi:hypothetical protein